MRQVEANRNREGWQTLTTCPLLCNLNSPAAGFLNGMKLGLRKVRIARENCLSVCLLGQYLRDLSCVTCKMKLILSLVVLLIGERVLTAGGVVEKHIGMKDLIFST